MLYGKGELVKLEGKCILQGVMTMRKIKIHLALCIVLIFVFVIPVKGQALEGSPELNVIETIIELVKEKYYEDVPGDVIIENAIKGIVEGLDPHSKYFSEEELMQFLDDVSGNYVGIGISFTKTDKHLDVHEVFADSPAYKAGLKPGDKIYSVNGEDIAEWTADEVSNAIKGVEGTKVVLEVLSDGIKRYVEIIREEVKLSPVTYRIIDDSIGLITITTFNENTYNFVTEAISYFDKHDVNKIILDLRDNTGGILEQAVYVAKLFVPKGAIVSIHERGTETKTYYSEQDNQKYKIAVLVNGLSASASEVLAGAIQDRECGVIIGTRTYGKGTVQKVYTIRGGGALKLTISNYITPNGRVITGEGITPDIIIEDNRDGINFDDVQLLTQTVKPSLGDKGIDVYNAEIMLKIAGYDIDTPDMELDEKTFEAIKKFQGDSGLGVYGRLDFTTQKALNEKFQSIKNIQDAQLLKAIEVIGKD